MIRERKPTIAHFLLVACLPLALCPIFGCGQTTKAQEVTSHPAVAVGPDEGAVVWFQPSSEDDVGEGSIIHIKIDRVSIPYSTMFVATQTLAATGIPVHLHTFEDEILYVLKGTGAAIVGEDRKEIDLEPGSVLYVPIGQWHGVRNDDPNERMEVFIVTTPSKDGGLGDFFRNATSQPGHPPLNLPEDEFLTMFDTYGMKIPEE